MERLYPCILVFVFCLSRLLYGEFLSAFPHHALVPLTPCGKKEADGGGDGVDDEHQAGIAAHDPEGAKGSSDSEDSYGLWKR